MNYLNQYEILIARYLNGTTSEEEKQQLFNWIELSQENKTTYLEIKDIWDATRKTENPVGQKTTRFL